jgi:hypothetical protein
MFTDVSEVLCALMTEAVNTYETVIFCHTKKRNIQKIGYLQ